MPESELPHNELVWWRMTKKQKYLPGRVVVLEIEAETVGIEDEDEKLLKKLLRSGSVIVNSFDDMKYAVCSSGNVRLYPTILEEEQRSLERDCIKSSKTNKRAILRIKKILELRKLDQVHYTKNGLKVPVLEINMIKFFKNKDNYKSLNESIEFFEKNTAVEILGSIIDRNSLKTMIGQSPQAFFSLERSLDSGFESKKCIDSSENSGFVLQTIDSKNWRNELSEITINRKTVYELLSCVPFEFLSSEKKGINSIEINDKTIFNSEWEESIYNWFNEKSFHNQKAMFIIEYTKLSVLYLKLLSKTVALRVVSKGNRGCIKEDKSNYVIVLSLGGVFCDPYDLKINYRFFTLRSLEIKNCKKKHWIEFLSSKNMSISDSRKSIKRNFQKIEGTNTRGISFCFKTTSELYNVDKSLFYKVDLTRISSQLVLSEELDSAYNNYHGEFDIKDLETRSKAFHKIKSSCPIMIKLLREFFCSERSNTDLTHSIEQIKKIREDLSTLD
ncbi:hypothetical protein FG386_001153 [Cryptosporidium ryanae]|uniref:uncharacterized protein n=1 Tax=Cryptosporidium ryanae TaxID=515981 RepID=UPI00351AAC40|nr:hypothetical protein FG386_001153 [Cryptosporidium ryanae]